MTSDIWITVTDWRIVKIAGDATVAIFATPVLIAGDATVAGFATPSLIAAKFTILNHSHSNSSELREERPIK